jgi:hypothetical protein
MRLQLNKQLCETQIEKHLLKLQTTSANWGLAQWRLTQLI